MSLDRFLYYWERFYYVFIFYYLEIPLYMQIRSISMYTFKASNSFCPYIIWFSVPKVIKCDLYLNYKQSFWKLLHCIPWHQFDSAFDPLGNQPKVVYWDYIFYFFNNFHSSLFVQLSYKKYLLNILTCTANPFPVMKTRYPSAHILTGKILFSLKAILGFTLSCMGF